MQLKSNFAIIENSAAFKKQSKHRWEYSQQEPRGLMAAKRYEAALAKVESMVNEARHTKSNKRVILARKTSVGFRILGHAVVLPSFDEVKNFARQIKFSHVRFLSNTISVN